MRAHRSDGVFSAQTQLRPLFETVSLRNTTILYLRRLRSSILFSPLSAEFLEISPPCLGLCGSGRVRGSLWRWIYLRTSNWWRFHSDNSVFID